MNDCTFGNSLVKDTEETESSETQLDSSTISSSDIGETNTITNDLNIYEKDKYNNDNGSEKFLQQIPDLRQEKDKSIIIDSGTDDRNQVLNEFQNNDICNYFLDTDYSVKEVSQQEAAQDTADFSLDMVTADMDFEQVYSMYSSIQQKDALSAVDELKKLQMLNEQYVTVLPSHFEAPNLTNEKFDFHRSQILTGSVNQQQKDNAIMGPEEPRSFGEGNEVEFDQFFSHTESNALERFLDNLANPANSDPLKFYNNYNARNIAAGEDVSHLFDLHTMKPAVDFKKSLEEEIPEAFGEPSMSSLKSISSSPTHDQLPTPCDSRNSSLIKNNLHSQALIHSTDQSFSVEASYSPSEPSPKRRRRVSHKPLLSLEQKRLNHSTSEQRRRQSCKLEYERCLRLVVNMEEYCKDTNQNKKSKRARINKDGLPNLSKHTALIKISGEIVRIKSKNEQLRKLLEVSDL